MGYTDYITNDSFNKFMLGVYILKNLKYILIISMLVSIFIAFCWSKIYKKYNKPGWHAFVPFLCMYTQFEIAGYSGWLFLVPVLNVFIQLLATIKIAKDYNKNTLFIIGLIFLPIVFIPLLAFSKSSNQVDNFQDFNNNQNYSENTNYNENYNQNLSNQDNNNQYKFCPNCGAKVSNDTTTCFMCGKDL